MSETNLSRSDVHRIYIAYGRSAILQFPCNVMSYSTGPTKDIEANLNEKKPQLLEVWLSKNEAEPAGLKVLCKDEIFAFDITPSKSVHQDFLKIKKATGSLNSQIEFGSAKVVYSSVTTAAKLPKILRTISSSKGESK